MAPAIMEEDKMSRQERKALRKDRENMREAKQSAYVRELMNYLEGRPEEITETVGPESRELTKYMAKMEERARQEEEHFTRAPLTNSEKMTMKPLKKSRNG
ncbi:Sas10/Utp3/C1D family [Forsythia ovata]|uniref:Sas10/Utp3/C1D family n=1 Tax=Forsythia ovata TaxID=205694 RepID=A0ABD1WI10_9LAMI